MGDAVEVILYRKICLCVLPSQPDLISLVREEVGGGWDAGRCQKLHSPFEVCDVCLKSQ